MHTRRVVALWNRFNYHSGRPILLVGFAGSGKSTAGEYIRDKFGYTSESFAKPLKDAVAAIFGWPREMLEGDTEESRRFREKPDPYWSDIFGRPYTPRMALQQMGLDVCRKHIHDGIWVSSLEKRLRESSGERGVVVTDGRFPNEIEAVRRQGGLVIWVKRGQDPEWLDTANKAAHGDEEAIRHMKDVLGIHESEWSFLASMGGGDGDDSVILQNDGTVEDFYERINSIVEPVLGSRRFRWLPSF